MGDTEDPGERSADPQSRKGSWLIFLTLCQVNREVFWERYSGDPLSWVTVPFQFG